MVWLFCKGLNFFFIVFNFEDYILEEFIYVDYDEFWKVSGINWEEYYE